jgi:hypothetical protein
LVVPKNNFASFPPVTVLICLPYLNYHFLVVPSADILVKDWQLMLFSLFDIISGLCCPITLGLNN